MKKSETNILQLDELDIRLPNWKEEDLESRLCPVCNENKTIPIVRRPDSMLVVKCDKCDMLFLNPCPSDVALKNFYNKYFSDFRNEFAISKENNINYINIKKDMRIKYLLKHTNFINKRVLDIGCGDGSFLMKAQLLGANRLTGLELDADMSQRIKNKTSFDILCTDIEHSKFEDESFDIITMWDVLEHIREPTSTLKTAHKLLKNGGILGILVPNGNNIHKNINWTGLRMDLEHINYFSSGSLETLLKKSKFQTLEIKVFGECYLNEMITGRKNLNDKIKTIKTRFPLIRKILQKYPIGYSLSYCTGKILNFVKSKDIKDYHLLVIAKKI